MSALGEFLVLADRKMLSFHDPAVDALAPDLALRRGAVVADTDRLCLRTARDDTRIRLVLHVGRA
ncbi:hypothetical protein [Actinokineospora inagensis]|uniref:hypothetical protein n=1 Tax=Actinokineospora inagensis TaxID=103730 RepID=UPI000429F880|nr:hypothetical protein [Actinokineospora inagensis]